MRDHIIDDLVDSAPRTKDSIRWAEGFIEVIDQRELPHRRVQLQLRTIPDLVAAINTLAIRGAPAIGLAGALGVAMSAYAHRGDHGCNLDAVVKDVERIAATRPTAVNLQWALSRVREHIEVGPDRVLNEALTMIAEDRAINQRLTARAAHTIQALTKKYTGLRILTHCNTGRFATSAIGTALGAILNLAANGQLTEVIVGETRPLLQGARLTAWELREAGVPHRLCVDSAAGSAMASGHVDAVVVGADRIARNGDTANKIGTYALAVLAEKHNIPFVVVAPESTWDETLSGGSEILIEHRPDIEVTELGGVRTAPEGTYAYNPAFDVTPAELITAIVTEKRVEYARRQSVQRLTDSASLATDIQRLLTFHRDFPMRGLQFVDLNGVYAAPGMIRRIAEAVSDHHANAFDVVLAIDARGFILGAAVAAHCDLPLVLARKKGKLPGARSTTSYDLEYGQATLEVQCGSIPPGSRVLIVDDVLATGGTVRAAADLVSDSEARVGGIAIVVQLTHLRGEHNLLSQNVFSLCQVVAQ